MKLTHIEIKNYRSLYHDDTTDTSFSLNLADGVNAIVGPNNTGKSNILRALALALDENTAFDRRLDIPVVRSWSRPAITLHFQVPKNAPSREETLLNRVDAYEKAVIPTGTSTYASKREVRLRTTIEGSGHSAGFRRRVFVARGTGAKTLSDDDPRLLAALKQFDKCLRFVLVRSGESLESLLQGRFREVLRTILQDDLRNEFDAAESSRQGYVEALRSGVLKKLGERIDAEISDLFPEVNAIKLEPEVPQLDATLTRMRVSVADAAVTDLADKGTGVRGGLIVAMLGHLADTGKRSMIFAVEEPEAFLHPAAQERLREDLEQLAIRRDVTLLVTTHSPYILSRRAAAKAFAVDKEPDGRTVLRCAASGDEPMTGALGGLFRGSLIVGFLERAAKVPGDAAAILVVEGETDRTWLKLAADRGDRLELFDGLAIVTAGEGIGDGSEGGAALAVMQALVLHSTSSCPIGVLVDDDGPGMECTATLRRIGSKIGTWKLRKQLFGYTMAIPNGDSAKFPYEAEDLWPDALHHAFVTEAGEDSVLNGKVKRPNPFGGWHYDYVPQAKEPLVRFIEDHATSEDCRLWIGLLEKIRAGLGI